MTTTKFWTGACPHCQHDTAEVLHSLVSGGTITKLYRCAACRKNFSCGAMGKQPPYNG